MVEGCYYRKADTIHGPFSVPRFRLLIDSGVILPKDLVRSNSNSEWKTLEEFIKQTDSSSIHHVALSLPSMITENDLALQTDDKTETTPKIENGNWYCRLGKDEYGPVKLEFIRKLYESRQLTADDQIKYYESGQWIRWQALWNFLMAKCSENQAKPNWLELHSAYQSSMEKVSQSILLQYRGVSGSQVAVQTDHNSSSRRNYREILRHGTKLIYNNKKIVLIMISWFSLNIFMFLAIDSSNQAKDVYARHFPVESVDQEVFDVYQTYLSLWQRAEKLKAENANNQRWRKYATELHKTIAPISMRLADSDNPAKITLYRIGRYQLIPLTRRRFQTNQGDFASWHLSRSMDDIKRALEQANFPVQDI